MKHLMYLLLSLFLIGCKRDSNEGVPSASKNTQTLKIKINGFLIPMDSDPENEQIKCKFTNGRFIFVVNNDTYKFKFSVNAPMESLVKGVFPIYKCIPTLECLDEKLQGDATLDNHEFQTTSNYYLRAYFVPGKDLTPLTLSIHEVQEFKREREFYKTKKIRGSFQGVLSTTVDPHPKGKEYMRWSIEGTFDVFCLLD